MIIGFYQNIYCAKDIDEEELVEYMKELAEEDLNNSDIPNIPIKQIVKDHLDEYIDFYMKEYIDLESSNKDLVFHQIKAFVYKYFDNLFQ